MKRRKFIKNAALAAAGLNIAPLTSAKELVSGKSKSLAETSPRVKKLPKQKKPHVIFIMSDQHRGDALGCVSKRAKTGAGKSENGLSQVAITPHIDKLASEGTLFTNAYSAAPSSTPARTGLLTGMTPWHHGMLGYGRVADHYPIELPALMKEQGYYTFAIGKNHWFPQKALHGYHGTLVDESGRVESPNFISDYRAWFMLHAPGEDPDKTGLGWNDHGAQEYKLDESLHPTTWTAETACEFLKNYKQDKPLFLKVSFARPHSPYDPPRRFVDMYKDVDMPTPVKGIWDEKFSDRKDPETAPSAAIGNFGDEYAKKSRKYYLANVTFIDEKIGEIIDMLKAKGMYDDALICYTADHGDMLGDHYHWRKTYAYEGSTKIPFIVKWPSSLEDEIEKKEVIDYPVELRDFLPTFMELAGGRTPSEVDGISLINLVRKGNDKIDWRKYLDLEHSTCYYDNNCWTALTDGKMKYIWFMRAGQEQLFDLERDPGEKENLINDKKYADTLKEMRTAMVEHLSERGEEFVKDGKLVKREKDMLYSPNYPTKN